MISRPNIIVTGGAGFIGSNFLSLMVPREHKYNFINIDKLTYAANLDNLETISCYQNYKFEQIDIADEFQVEYIFEKFQPEIVINFAAESHVDNSISSPKEFIRTNIEGTFCLLEAARRCRNLLRFHHVSTDEVYGSLGEMGQFVEITRYNPSSPYSASKAASDHLVCAYGRTYGLPVTITNCSNNYGPRQFSEKLIPLCITNILKRKSIPIYGQGTNIRDWLYVDDHCEAIWLVINLLEQEIPFLKVGDELLL